VSSLYDVMDSAYDAAEIAGYSRRLEHVPIIDPNARRGQEARPLCPAGRARVKGRTAGEPGHPDPKGKHGGGPVAGRGGDPSASGSAAATTGIRGTRPAR
jgi:hypothetical protein